MLRKCQKSVFLFCTENLYNRRCTYFYHVLRLDWEIFLRYLVVSKILFSSFTKKFQYIHITLQYRNLCFILQYEIIHLLNIRQNFSSNGFYWTNNVSTLYTLATTASVNILWNLPPTNERTSLHNPIPRESTLFLLFFAIILFRYGYRQKDGWFTDGFK